MLVGELFGGPVDVIGDVHGEIEPLAALLRCLGYGDDGLHAERRRVVFVGDLTDRGPNSPAVVELVATLVARGRAQCVLGNHELNILRDDRKQGNGWFFGEVETFEGNGRLTGEALADERTRDETRSLFSTLPLALERDDLRVVHAAWDDAHVDRARGARQLLAWSQSIEDQLDEELGPEPADEQRTDSTEGSPPRINRALAQWRVARQNRHPVKVLTSGFEDVAEKPFCAGGKLRFEQRRKWWDDYEGPMVVIGHYWRSAIPGANTGKGPDPFEGTAPEDRLGRGHVMCVDYSIGNRARERARPGRTQGKPFVSRLAAYRWPERQLVFSPV